MVYIILNLLNATVLLTLKMVHLMSRKSHLTKKIIKNRKQSQENINSLEIKTSLLNNSWNFEQIKAKMENSSEINKNVCMLVKNLCDAPKSQAENKV